jgi:ATP-dependent Clp protease ATP-binding subunit ClpA
MRTDPTQQNPPLPFQASIWLENKINFSNQRNVLLSLFGVFLLAVCVWAVFGPWQLIPIAVSPKLVATLSTVAEVIILLTGTLLVITGTVHCFYLYYRLSCVSTVANESADNLHYTFPAAVWLQSINEDDHPLTANRFGRELLLRLGIKPQLALNQRPPELDTSFMNRPQLQKAETVTLHSILQVLLKNNEQLADWLLSFGINKEAALQAARWVERRNQRWVRRVRFWSPQRLAEMSRLGKRFNYGQTPNLDRYTRQPEAGVFVGSRSANAFIEDTRRLLQILTRPRSANALLVGGEHEGVNDVIQELDNQLQTREAPSSLADYQLHVLSLQSLIAATDTGPELERLLSKLLAEALQAGNVLLVIKDFPRLLAVGEKRQVDMLTLLEPFVRNQKLPVLATARSDTYHNKLQHSQFMQWFGAVEIGGLENETFLSLLEETAERYEGRAACTIDGLRAIIRYGRQVITDDQMPHAAVDLLLEILQQTADGFVDGDRVSAYVAEKTDMPVGEIDAKEKDRLTGLETTLHERVIGQDPAISAVSSALRRSRAGLEDSRRPIGSFLFLGPTGVGKTETAKAVAAAYFENQPVTLRFDMSEFSSAGSVTELIGDAESDGRLSNTIRSNPSGVMLLDEFEKAHTDVHDLFLQILDEGFFTDGAGHEVACGNLIIIATSNAGAEHIFSLISDGRDPAENKRDIIDRIIEGRTLRPELINRFTETVIFRPLTKQQLTAVTKKFLQQLQTRLRERGIRLEVADGVPKEVAEAGYDPEFGARAVRRYLQQTAENIIADKIIAEDAKGGQAIHLSVADIQAAA